MRSEELAEPLYVSRPVLNADDLVEWAKSQGLSSMLLPDDLHVTVCYSKEPLVWDDVPETEETVRVPALDEFKPGTEPVRKIEMFGKEHNVLVIQLESDDLHSRWQQFCDAGASYDFPEYKPHISITYKGGGLGEAVKTLEPYRGEIILGPERFKPIDKTWAGDAPEIDLTEEEPLPFEELAETVIYSDEQSFILEEPTALQINNLMRRSGNQGLNGLLVGGALLVWEASAFTHAQAMRRLHLSEGQRLHFSPDRIEIIEAADLKFDPSELDGGGWSEHDIEWFKKAHREINECWSVLEDHPTLNEVYDQFVPLSVNDEKQWSGLSSLASDLFEDYPAHPDTLGAEPPRPRSFFGYVADMLNKRSRALGLPVRIDAEEAVDKGVPGEYIFFPNGSIKAPANKIFSSRHGSLHSKDVKLISLDWDHLDPLQWGITEEIDPEVIGDLLRRAFERDESALDRYDPRYDRWAEWHTEMESSMEFWDRYGDEDGNLLPDDEIERLRAEYPPIGIPDDEIIDLYGEPDDLSYGAGPERFDHEPIRLHETVGFGDLRVLVNPSRAILAEMCETHPVSGLLADDSIYVWPTAAAPHRSVIEGLEVETALPFYAFIPEFGETLVEAAARFDQDMRLRYLDDGVVIAARHGAHTLVNEGLEGRKPSSRFSGPLLQTEALVEATNDPLPKKFWLVFDVPSDECRDAQDLARVEDRLAQIGSGQLEGVRGISETREIVVEWFLMCRNAVAVMEPAAVAAENDIERVHYTDTEYLCRKNFAALYRVWDKEGRQGKPNHYGLFQNVMEYVLAHVKKMDASLGYYLDYYGVGWKAAKLWEEDPTGVNSVADAARRSHELILRVCEEGNHYALRQIKESLTEEVLVRAFHDALRYVGSIYASEGEWIVHSDRFTIPKNSILMIGIDRECAEKYQQWLKDPEAFKAEDPFGWLTTRLERHKNLMDAIERYGLRDRYAIRFVDARKFENMRGDVAVARKKKRKQDA